MKHLFAASLILAVSCAFPVASGAGERPEFMRQFEAAQHESIRRHGEAALRALKRQLTDRQQLQRVTFIARQQRQIVRRGEVALASLKQDLCCVFLTSNAAQNNKAGTLGFVPAIAAAPFAAAKP